MADVIRIDASAKRLTVGGQHFDCRIGKAGFIDWALGREGDAKTPVGQYFLRFGLYRGDRLPPPQSKLPFWEVHKNDGWCDAPADPAYNRFIRLPYTASHEPLWREDGAYDLVIIMSHNDSPPQMGLGSAVFLHVTQADDRETLGCVALSPENWVRILPHMFCGQQVEIIG